MSHDSHKEDESQWVDDSVLDEIFAGESFAAEVLTDQVDDIFNCCCHLVCCPSGTWGLKLNCAFRYHPAVGLFFSLSVFSLSARFTCFGSPRLGLCFPLSPSVTRLAVACPQRFVRPWLASTGF